MGKLTAYSIRPVIAGVGYHPNRTPQAPELAQIDQQLAQFGADKINGCSVTGRWSLAQDPNNPGSAPSITAPINVIGAGATLGTAPGGGKLVLANNQVPSYSPARTRRVRYSTLEAMRAQVTLSGGSVNAGSALVVDVNTGGVYQALPNASGALTLPITKPMDGATVTNVAAYFYVPSLPSAISGALNITLKSVAVAGTSSVDVIVGTNSIAMSSLTPSQWFNNGAAQSIQLPDTAVVASATVTSGGGSYSSAPAVHFAAPGGGGVTATGTAVMTGSGSTQSVASITITNPGSGYTSIPTISFSPTGAAATANLNPTAPLGMSGAFLVGSNAIALTSNVYVLQISGPATTGGLLPNPIFTAVEIDYIYADERFTQ